MRVGAVSLAIVATFASSAAAQSEGASEEAVAAYRRARELYAAGQYRDASVALERALELDPGSPTLVYNLARVYELMGELERSVEYYERYQELLPQQHAREQERAEATIRRLRGAQRDASPASAPPRAVEPLRQLPGVVLVRESGVADEAFWIALIGGAASVAIGVTFGILALDARSRADGFVLRPNGAPVTERTRLYADAQTFGIVTDVTIGVGAAAILAAGLLYFLREHTVERAPIRAVEPSASFGRDGAIFGARGCF